MKEAEAQKDIEAHEDIRNARRVYYQEWAKKNRDRLRENQRRFYQRLAARMKAEEEEKA